MYSRAKQLIDLIIAIIDDPTTIVMSIIYMKSDQKLDYASHFDVKCNI